MKANRRKDRDLLKSRGSAVKKALKRREHLLDPGDWTVGTIAWNRDGNIVILDPRVARIVRDQARKDREFEVGIPNLPVEVGDGTDSGAPVPALATAPTAGSKPPQPLTLCGCEVMRFILEREFPAQTKLLSSDPLRGTR